MATSYGYSGEFSSDEDIDRIERQSEKLVQTKFDAYAAARLNKRQVEELIETIKRIPVDQDVQLTDEHIAGLLDYYKTQRGPIVDSTRNLYKKIVLRLVRGVNAAHQEAQGNGTAQSKDSFAAVANNNNIIIKNSVNANNNNNNYTVRKPIQHPAETFSSDEDEPMIPVDGDAKKSNTEQVEPMEIDPVANAAQQRREPKLINITDDESEESEDDEDAEGDEVADKAQQQEDDDESDEKEVREDKSSDSDELDVTPIKPTSHVLGQTPKATSTPLAQTKQRKTARDSQAPSTAQKPYTRSQRMAAARASSASNAADSVTNATSAPVRRTKTKLLVGALVVMLIAFLIYYFRSNVMKTTDRFMSRKITF